MLHWFMKERSHSNVTFVTTALLERVVWRTMFYQFMKKKRHSNVTFSNKDVLIRVTLIHILHLFMKERSHSNVKFVTTALLKRLVWIDMLHQFMKVKKLFSRVASVCTIKFSVCGMVQNYPSLNSVWKMNEFCKMKRIKLQHYTSTCVPH